MPDIVRVRRPSSPLAPVVLGLVGLMSSVGLAAEVAPLSWRAVGRDGSVFAGENLEGFDNPLGEWKLKGQRIDDRGGGLRHLARLGSAPRVAGPFVELRGGDRLVGRLVGVSRDGSGQLVAAVLRPPARTTAQGEAEPDGLSGRATVQVRAELIVAWSAGPGGASGDGGFDALLGGPASDSAATGCRYRLRDGGIESARSARLTPEGLRVLSTDGVRLVPYESLLGCRFAETAAPTPLPGLGGPFLPTPVDGPPPSAAEAGRPTDGELASLLGPERFWPVESRVGPLVTVHLTDGGRVSFSLALCRVAKAASNSKQNAWAVLPTWAAETLWLDRGGVAALTFLQRTELLLDGLPLVPVVAGRGLVAATARRGLGPARQALGTGDVTTAPGLAMHAPYAVQVPLPPGVAKLTGLVGFGRAAGAGGCAVARLGLVASDRSAAEIRAAAEGWTRSGGGAAFDSQVLTGAEKPRRFELPVGERDRTLVVAVDAGPADRPPGADVLDVRDDVEWTLPILTLRELPTVDLAALTPFWVPAWQGWRIVEARGAKVTLEPVWLDKGRFREQPSWAFALGSDGKTQPPPEPETPTRRRPRKSEDATEILTLERRGPVTLDDAVLTFEVVAGKAPGKKSKFVAAVEGELIASMGEGHLPLAREDASDKRSWSLGGRAGSTVAVQLVLAQDGEKDHRPASFVVRELSRSPLVRGLPPTGELPSPATPLSDRTPTATTGPVKPEKLVPPADGELAKFHGVGLAPCVVVPAGSSLTYAVGPTDRRFVAMFGMIEGGGTVGPLAISFDGREAFRSDVKLHRPHAGEALDVPVPAGATSMTITVEGQNSQAILGRAGFVGEAAPADRTSAR